MAEEPEETAGLQRAPKAEWLPDDLISSFYQAAATPVPARRLPPITENPQRSLILTVLGLASPAIVSGSVWYVSSVIQNADEHRLWENPGKTSDIILCLSVFTPLTVSCRRPQQYGIGANQGFIDDSKRLV